MIEEPIGHEAVRETLRALAQRRSGDAAAALHHAWLFAGPAGVGKFQVARWWASLLKCPQAGGCDASCQSCRLLRGGVHPDVLETSPELEGKKSFGVDESRALLHRLMLRPLRPGPRIAIVREAATMTPDAQNALLKLLEEPPGSAVIVLVTDNIGAMLPTVRSRCRHLAFGALADGEIARVLVKLGKTGEEAAAAAACAHGSVARALAMDAEGLADREKTLLAFEAVRRDCAAIEPLVQSLAARKDDGYSLAEILEWQLSKIHAALGRRDAEPSPQLASVLDDCRSVQARTLIEEAERILYTIDAIARNANAKLVIRDLLMNVRA